MMQPTQRNAFTLLELLIVVALIALLVTLLFPAYGRARGAARRVICGSQLRQIGQALTIYSESTEGEFYPPMYGIFDTPDYHWMGKLLPFGMKERMFFCPADPNLNSASSIFNPANNISHSYVLNAFDELLLPAGASVSLRQIEHPSSVILASEKKSSETDFYLSFSAGEFNRVLAQDRHGGGGNFLFADGHLEHLADGKSLAPVNFWTLTVAD